jgi:hypothetical protein
MSSQPALTHTSLETAHLLAALPLGAALTVAARTVLGARTIGVFAPALLGLVLVDLGLRTGMVVILVAALGGLVALPVVVRLALPRVARLGLLLSAICAALEVSGLADDQRAALPVVVMTVLVERGWDVASGDGWRACSALIGSTLLLAVVIASLLLTPPVEALMTAGDLRSVVVGGLLVALAGSYRGLRVGEHRRFASLRGATVAQVN